jgi:cytochrome c-type biogenesis protein CcmE
MHSRKKKAIKLVVTILLVSTIFSYILLKLLNKNIVFFIKPSEITQKHFGKKIRIGGLVKENSVSKIERSCKIHFILEDKNSFLNIFYSGALPKLFRERQGVVAEGVLVMQNNKVIFKAEKLLIKHDENYKPQKYPE